MGGGCRRVRVVMAAAVAAAAIFIEAGVRGQATTAAAGTAGVGGARYLAGRLMDDVRRLLRDPAIGPEIAAKQAVILLTLAQKLDETGAAGAGPNAAGADAAIPRMLAEAARAAGNIAARKDALRKVIELDHSDLLAQVAYLDLLASATQLLEERARIYQSAMDKADLSPQIRSEMAVRLAGISEERGDADAQKAFLQTALKFNDVNVTALRALARIAGENPNAVPERVAALVALLVADAYQPDAWVELARICEGANLHSRASDFLLTALEQMQLQGVSPSGDLYLEYGMEMAAAGRRTEAFAIINGLARLPDAPVTALAAAEILAADDVPGSGFGGGDATRPEKDLAAERVRNAAIELSKHATGADGAPVEGGAAALADAAGLALTALPALDPQVNAWIDAYAKLVAPEDTTLGRLRGWQLYRSGKLDEARAALEKPAANGDPMAQIGLARVLIDQNKGEEAAKQLQDIWTSHPRGVIALQVTEAARHGNITLNDTQWTKQIREAVAHLPANLIAAHRQPREIVLATAALRKVSVGLGEPAIVSIRMTNATDRPVPVGPNGLAVTSIGMSATVRGTPATPLGVFFVDDVQRVYRLEAHGVMETTIRIDQGQLADVFERNPLRTFIVGFNIVTAPRLTTTNDVTPGLGGQPLYVSDLQRGGMPIETPADFEKLRQDLAGASGEKLLIRIRMAEALLAPLAPSANPASATSPAATQRASLEETARKGLIESLLPLFKSNDAMVRAALIRSLPPGNWGDEMATAVAALDNDSDALVRILWSQRLVSLAHGAADSSKNAAATLEKQLAGEKDDTVKQWLSLELESLKTPTPTSQPATPNATTRGATQP